MSIYANGPTSSSRADHPLAPDRPHNSDCARRAVLDAFGWRFAKSLEQADFVDRLPGELPKLPGEPQR